MPDLAHAKGDETDASRRNREPAPAPFEVLPGDTLAIEGALVDRLRLAAAAGDPGLPPAGRSVRERQAFAVAMNRVHGNRRLSRIIARTVQRQTPAPAPAAAGGPPVGAVPTGQALRARAQEVLSNTYGSTKKIVPARVEVVTEGVLRQKFDEMQIRKGTRNPRTQEPWKMGDSLLVFKTLDGFADRDNGVIYVPESPAGGGGADSQLSTVVHEMLHTNAAGDWASTVGMAIDEGETEILTMRACKSQNVPITPAYAGQRATTEQLVPVVGADTLQRAYFGGAAILGAAVEAVLGEGKWEKLQAAIKSGDRDKFDELLRARHASDWAKEKIRTILGIIDEWWVSDEDVDRIVAICGTASAEDLKAISDAVSPQVTRLNSHGQRARIRIALGH